MAIASQQGKYVAVIPPAAIVDNSAFTTAQIDTAGFSHAKFVVFIGATDIAASVMQVTESDSDGSGHAAITGMVWGTSTNTDGDTSTKPEAGDDDTFWIMDIDLKGRKRYLDLNLTAGNGTAGTYACAWCELTRADETPTTATQRGAHEVLKV